MINLRRISIATATFALACNGGSSSTGSETSGGETSTDESESSTGTTGPSMTTTPPETGPEDTTAGPVDDCVRTIRYPLFGEQACGRVLVGDIDGDGFDDTLAFGRDPKALLGTTTTMQTLVGGTLGLESGEVHCCIDTTAVGAGAVFDINGDGYGDPLWSGENTTFEGDVGTTFLTFEKAIRAPEHGYTARNIVQASELATPAFVVGRITPQEIGVLAIVDGELLSMIGNGEGLGLETVGTLALDPVPSVRAITTVEIDGAQGVDVAGIGPDGLLVWGGSLEGAFTQAVVTALPGDYTDIESVDLDLNGSRQLVLFGAGEPVALIEGDGKGGVIITTDGTPMLDPPATVIEVDNDLYPDLVGFVGGNLVMYAGDGTGFAAEPTILAPAGTATDVAFGDFDGDGSADVVACDDQGLLVVYREER